MSQRNQKIIGQLGGMVIIFFSIIWAFLIHVKNKLFTKLRLFAKNNEWFSLQTFPEPAFVLRVILYALLIVITALYGPLSVSLITVLFGIYFEILNYEVHVYLEAKKIRLDPRHSKEEVKQLEKKISALLVFSIIVFILLLLPAIIPLCKPEHKELRFSIDADFEEELNGCFISKKLKDEFNNKGCPLTNNPMVIKKEESEEWMLIDKKKFILQRVEKKLNVYECSILLRVLWKCSILKGKPSNVVIESDSFFWDKNWFWGVISIFGILIGGEVSKFCKYHPQIHEMRHPDKAL